MAYRLHYNEKNSNPKADVVPTVLMPDAYPQDDEGFKKLCPTWTDGWVVKKPSGTSTDAWIN